MQARNSIIPLSFDHQEIRAVDDDGEPWFVADDICDALGVHRTQVRKLEADEKGVRSIHTLGGMQEVAVLTEAGVYTLALRCRDAMKAGTAPYRFRKWVTGTALPALRRGHDPMSLTPDMRGAIGGIVKGIVQKQLAEIIPALVNERVMSGRLTVVEGVCAVEVVEMAGYKTGMRPKGSSQFVTRRLARFHEERGVPIRRDRRGIIKARLFDEVTARQWLSAGGQVEIDHYIAGRKGQGSLKLVR